MKTIQYITAAICITALHFISGCDEVFKRCGGDFSFTLDNPHQFELYDYQTGDNLLGIHGRYQHDTVKIFDANGRIYFGGPVGLNGTITFGLVTIEDYGVVDQMIIRELYLYLSHQDIDTLQYEFEMQKNDCNRQVYRYTKLTYNDSVYVDEYNDRFRFVKLYKK